MIPHVRAALAPSLGWPLLAALLLGCAGAAERPKPAGSAAAAPSPAPAAAPAPAPVPAPSPALENALGLIGAPRDDTAFEYDVEDHDDDPAPVLDGIPPVTRAVGRALAPYLDVRRARLAAVAPGGNGLIALTRLGETTHVHRLDRPLGARRQLTFGPEPIEQAAFVPGSTRLISYRGDVAGTEEHQIFVLDASTRETRRLTDGKSRHGPFRWAGDGQLAFTRLADNGTDTDLYVWPKASASPVRFGPFENAVVALGWSGDAKQLLLHEFRAVDESTVHVLDVAENTLRSLAPLGKGRALRAAIFGRPGHVYVTAVHDKDHAAVYEVHLESLHWRQVTPDHPHDVEEITARAGGNQLAYTVNEDGYSRLRLFDRTTHWDRALKLPDGVVTGLRFVQGRQALAFTLTTATAPADVYLFDLTRQRLERWTESEVGGLSSDRFVTPDRIDIPSFDGLRIPSILYRPVGEGPFPVLLWMHGGPEEQSRPMFDPIVQYFAAARKIAVLAPNIRGSSGYGAKFMSLDDGKRRHEAIRDVGAVLDYVAKRPDLDAGRVGIYGASYGGYMALAALVSYPQRLAAGASNVGMSNLVSFLENTRDYRRDLRRREYGDERDPSARAYLHEISPLGAADRIRSALFLAHGENDPRVPFSEAEQLVRAVRGRGGEAWLFVARGQGHSFKQRRTRDLFYRCLAEFFERHLVQVLPPPAADQAD